MINNNLLSVFKDFFRHESEKVGDTHELTAVAFNILNIDSFNFEKYPFFNYSRSLEVFNTLINEYNSRGDFNIQIENYNLQRYQQMITDFHILLEEVDSNDQNFLKTTRQLSITFDQMHCFQFIQFIFRGNELNIHIGMRSCDIVNNLFSDLFLVSKLGMMITSAFNKQGKTYIKQTNLKCFIGSLHVYDKDYISFRERISAYVVRASQAFPL